MRHLVVERCLPEGQLFVPNDAHLVNDETQIMILTGPNSSGKSTYLRQAALIVLLAQIGSFVPAEAAIIGLADRIFSREGLEDNISRGQSRFMPALLQAKDRDGGDSEHLASCHARIAHHPGRNRSGHAHV